MSSDDDVGIRFAKAFAAQDASALLDVLRPDVDFRALTPGRAWEASSAKEVVDGIMFGHWIHPSDHVEALEWVEPGRSAGPRHRVGYRLRVRNDDGAFVIDQQAYFEADNERITWLRVMCSGWVPVDTTG